MGYSFKTFLKHTAKDFYNQSVNPPVVRASTILFKSLNDIRKTQKKHLKNRKKNVGDNPGCFGGCSGVIPEYFYGIFEGFWKVEFSKIKNWSKPV